MGTRNLTLVKFNGAFPVAQYGQWDGYPEGCGVTALGFAQKLTNPNTLEKFKKTLAEKTTLIPRSSQIDYLISLGYEVSKTFISWETDKLIAKNHPNLSRDTGAEILDFILAIPEETKDKVVLIDDSNYIGEFDCEWVWYIDLDAMVFGGFSCDTNFASLQDIPQKEENNCRGSNVYSLSNLPDETTFFKNFGVMQS